MGLLLALECFHIFLNKVKKIVRNMKNKRGERNRKRGNKKKHGLKKYGLWTFSQQK